MQVISKTPRGPVKKFDGTKKSFGAFTVAGRGLKISIFLASAAIAICIAAATPAAAADVEPPSSYDWSGPYIGLHDGYGWGDSQVDEIDPETGLIGQTQDYSHDGFISGIHDGWDLQSDSLVWGIVGEIEFADVSGTQDFGGSTDSTDKNIRLLSSLRLCTGFAADRALFYATGGLAAGLVDMEASEDNFTASISGSSFTVGYTVGGGVEFAFSDDLSGLLENRYTDIGNTDHTGNIFGGDFTYDHENAFHPVRAGVSWHL